MTPSAAAGVAQQSLVFASSSIEPDIDALFSVNTTSLPRSPPPIRAPSLAEQANAGSSSPPDDLNLREEIRKVLESITVTSDYDLLLQFRCC